MFEALEIMRSIDDSGCLLIWKMRFGHY